MLTPQLFVDNTKLCDEDVDLGLEFALTVMLDRHAKGTLAPPPSATPAPAAPVHAAPVEAPKPRKVEAETKQPVTKPEPAPTPAPAKPDEPAPVEPAPAPAAPEGSAQ